MMTKIRRAKHDASFSTLPIRENNRKEFGYSPVVVNAYQDFPKNAVFMLASILRGSFYDREYPRSINYGSIGYVVGHELTHGYDDQGEPS
ncbi:endothelin-converting enzyme 2, partial [Aphelenchoides avenae]